jgi:hypothetical protein
LISFGEKRTSVSSNEDAIVTEREVDADERIDSDSTEGQAVLAEVIRLLTERMERATRRRSGDVGTGIALNQ